VKTILIRPYFSNSGDKLYAVVCGDETIAWGMDQAKAERFARVMQWVYGEL
jgi:hypothetical protein